MLIIRDGKILIPFEGLWGKKVKYEHNDWPGEIFEGTLAGISDDYEIIAVEPHGDSLHAPYVEGIKWLETV